jgi:hypothetical protein
LGIVQRFGVARCATRMFSITVRSGKISRPSGTYATPARATRCGGRPVISAPSSSTRPRRGAARPMIVRIVVVLPTPLRPRTAPVVPGASSMSTPCSTWLAP